jgi:type II secretory pathway pseudopilin PulG
VTSRVFWVLVLAALIAFVVMRGASYFGDKAAERQAQAIQNNAIRCAQQCYMLEGSFPATAGGIEYLRDKYGLTWDERRFAVYYESTGENLTPVIHVVAISKDAPKDYINEVLRVPVPSGHSEQGN